jgi:tRNA threonylcarbamoyladenosine modification (KEOPS) complex  Pcc1 subunit
MPNAQLALVTSTHNQDHSASDVSRTALTSVRRDVWTEPATGRVRFVIEADAEPESLARLMNFFSQQLLLPQSIQMTREGDSLLLTIEQHDLSAHRAEVIAQKMRSLICVAQVSLLMLS